MKWEYIITDSGAHLKKLGKEGWELIQVVPSCKSAIGGVYNERWVFKRSLPEDVSDIPAEDPNE